MSGNIRWVKVADFITDISFGDNGIAEVVADGKKICMARHHGKYFAFANKCPHASGLFSQGYIDALGNVVCPVHRYKFCMANGRNVTGEGYYLKHWPVQVTDAGILVGFEQQKLFGLL